MNAAAARAFQGVVIDAHAADLERTLVPVCIEYHASKPLPFEMTPSP